MKVRCPKHNKEDLIIKYTSINMLGNKYPVVTGQCPVCKIKYLSKEIMSSSGSFKIGGQAYEYLNEMEMAYPHPFKPLTHAKEQAEAMVKAPVQDPVVMLESKPKDVKVESEPKKIKLEPKPKGVKVKKDHVTKAERKKKQKEDLLKKLASGEEEAFHVHRLRYPLVMPQVCMMEGEELYYVDHVVIDTAGAGIKTRAWCCLKCKTAYILKEDQENIREKLRQVGLQQNSNENIVFRQNSPILTSDKTVNLAIPQNTLYVCKGLIVCNRNGHNVESGTGIMLAKNGAVIKINTNYCPQCRKYFISHDEYMRYRKLYGVLLGNIKLTNGSFLQSKVELAEESILHMCGYSVNQTDNLSSAVRQGILQYLIDSKVSNKPEIIDYLNFFIRRNGKKQNMGEAVRRWTEDLKWVREYQINRQRHFEIANIAKNK